MAFISFSLSKNSGYPQCSYSIWALKFIVFIRYYIPISRNIGRCVFVRCACCDGDDLKYITLSTSTPTHRPYCTHNLHFIFCQVLSIYFSLENNRYSELNSRCGQLFTIPKCIRMFCYSHGNWENSFGRRAGTRTNKKHIPSSEHCAEK